MSSAMYHAILCLNLQRSTIKALCGLHLWIDHSCRFCIIPLPADEVTKSIWIIEKLNSHYQQDKVSGRNVIIDSMRKRCLSQVCSMMMISNGEQTQISSTNRMDELFS